MSNPALQPREFVQVFRIVGEERLRGMSWDDARDVYLAELEGMLGGPSRSAALGGFQVWWEEGQA